MAIKGSHSHGDDSRRKVRRALEVILDYADELVSDTRKSQPMMCRWLEDGQLAVHNARVNTILNQVNSSEKLVLTADEIKRSFGDLEALGLLTDQRGGKKQGSTLWRFDLKFQQRERQAVLAEFDRLWREKWTGQPGGTTPMKPVEGIRSGLKSGPLMHGIPLLPDNYVVRSDALKAVKEMLLKTTDRTKVSAIVGMGGLGKSLLAAKLVQDEEIKRRFEDGILWVTLGQNPESLLQSKLGELIEVLDKSRDRFSATTLGAASQYLNSLLADKRTLLVVDDVWDEHHLRWFRVGGSECRILLTTRLNSLDVIPHELKVMSSDEAQMLIKNELRDKWTAEMEKPARSFSKSLGYLPFALQLMAVQVRRGRSWEYLNKALSEKSKRLQALDRHDVKLTKLSEEEQREYSLKACLQLSLRWLDPEQLSKFIWLGVLPEDATIRQGMAIVLWDVADWEAEEGLLALYESSLLSRGADTWDGEATYRVHDLLHVLAKELIEKPRSIVGKDTLLGLGLSFADAQVQFLERYRGRSADGSWYGLANDGYIHRHLTWHLEMAGQLDAVHELMASGEDQNDWFEACDKIGQPGIFVQDVRRGWRLAEELYERDRGRAIVLQCRYALITGTLNSLVGNLSGELMAAFVKGGFWSIEQAWSYVEQMQDQGKIAEAIKALAAYLTKPLFTVAVEKAQLIYDESSRAEVLAILTQIDSACFFEALDAARSIQDYSRRAWVLSALAQMNSAYFSEALNTACRIENEDKRSAILCKLANVDSADFNKILEVACSMSNEQKTSVLSELAKGDSTYFTKALDMARSLQDSKYRAECLIRLAEIDSTCAFEAFESIRSIQDNVSGYPVVSGLLSSLAKIDYAYFSFALEEARLIEDAYWRANILTILSDVEKTCIIEALDAVYLIQDKSNKLFILIKLIKIDSAYFTEALKVARSIQDESSHAWTLSGLAKLDFTYVVEALEAVRLIEDESSRAWIFSLFAEVDLGYFAEALEAARSIQNESNRSEVLSFLANIDSADSSHRLEAVRSIQDESSRAKVLIELANIDFAYFAEALETARSIQDESNRTKALIELANIDSTYFAEALETARSIQDESNRAKALIKLANINSTYFAEALEAAQSIQYKEHYVMLLIELANIDSAYFLQALEAARAIQNEYFYASALCELAKLDSANFSQLLDAVRSIQDESRRAKVLIELAQKVSADCSLLLDATRSIQNESSRAEILIELANFTPNIFLPEIYQVIIEITHNADRANALSSYISRLPLASLPYTDWTTYLHLLTQRTRADLMGDLATLYPAILHLGGEDAGRGMVGEMGRVCKQWK